MFGASSCNNKAQTCESSISWHISTCVLVSSCLSTSCRTAVCLFFENRSHAPYVAAAAAAEALSSRFNRPASDLKPPQESKVQPLSAFTPAELKGPQMRELHAARPSSVVQDTHPAYPLIICYQSWDHLLLLCFSSRSPVFNEFIISTFY